MYVLSLLPPLIPILISLVLYFKKNNNKILNRILCIAPLGISLILNIVICFTGHLEPLVLFKISENLLIVAQIDTTSKFFALLISLIMIIVTIYSFKYFEEDERKNHFDAFFINKKFKAKDISDAVEYNSYEDVKQWLNKELQRYGNL